MTIDRPTTFTLDLNGSVTRIQSVETGTTTYAWDTANRLSGVLFADGTRLTETYRFDDMRIAQSGPSGIQTFSWLDRDVLAEQGTKGSQSWSELFTRRYGHDPGGAAPNLIRAVGNRSDGINLERQFHLDALGSVQATTDSSQVTETTYRTDAWGVLQSGAAADNPYLYLGGLGYWYEPTLGQYYVRARWLDPDSASWLASDAAPSEPRFRYANNAPTFRVDPSGMQVHFDDGSSTGAAVPAPVLPRPIRPLPAKPREFSKDLKDRAAARTTAFIRARIAELRPDLRSQGERKERALQTFGLEALWNLYWTGEPYPSSAELRGSYQAGREQLEAMKNSARRGYEAYDRRMLQFVHRFIPSVKPSPEMLRSHQTIVRQAGRLGFLVPPIPGTAESQDWLEGFKFGVADSLVSNLLLPIDVLVSIGPTLEYLTSKPDVLEELKRYAASTYGAYMDEVNEATRGDAFTRGKITARLLVDLVLNVLLARDVAKGFGGLVRELGHGRGLAMADEMRGTGRRKSGADIRRETKAKIQEDVGQARQQAAAPEVRQQVRVNPHLEGKVPEAGTARTGIERAARLEVELVKRTGKGTVDWTTEEIEFIVKRGMLPKGTVVGHHINSKAAYPAWQGDPRNIKFVRGRDVHFEEEHNRDYRIPTEGDLIDRMDMIKKAGGT